MTRLDFFLYISIIKGVVIKGGRYEILKVVRFVAIASLSDWLS